MRVHVIDPLGDSRWAAFLEQHPRASVFHTCGWLDALRRTYGYEPYVLTTTPPGAPLENGLPLCRVKSWFGRRLVSLPFSDHCEPLIERPEELRAICSFLEEETSDRGWRYAELRPRGLACVGEGPGGLQISRQYCLHRIDLSGSVDEIFRRLHPSCVRRAVRRAQRERLTYEAGSSPALVARFYRLLRTTRRRHGLPPQPFSWFRNLVACLGDRLAVRVVSRSDEPIAAMLTLSHGRTMVYKYGASDERYHSLGGVPFLFWQTMQEARALEFTELDLGRSDLDQAGLIAFKDRLGGERSTLTYLRCPAAAAQSVPDGTMRRTARHLLARLPSPALSVAGRLLYRHLG